MRTLSLVVVLAFSASGVCAAEELDKTTQRLLDVDRSLQQLDGQFPTLLRDKMPAGRIQESWSRARPGAAVRQERFDPMAEMKIRLREGAHTLVALPTWERVRPGGVVVGSREAVSVRVTPEGVGNRLVFVPGQVGRDSSITVIGESGRIYAFYVQVENDRSPTVPDLVVYVDARQPLDWEPPATPQTRADGRPTDYLRELPFSPSRTSFSFTMSGDPAIAPVQVFSDGVFTFLYFGPNGRIDTIDLPTVHRVIDSVDTPVNVRRAGDMLVVEAPVGEGLTLRAGQKSVCIRRSTS